MSRLLLNGETFEIPFPKGYRSICIWKGHLMLGIQAELVQEIHVKAELPQVKNKLVVYFTQLPQR